ncbi:signal transduction histidine kinase, LytS [Chitinophaga pinensis DSM 2588]|uniref:Signal transduction histidine kinase, LytS n=2 Tax=Chitinophaga pinensis TaxID=79329 RepID=A0A979GS51_CHIPD|nr:signal transduction histidine kinase, LytS [Chitinophaga pinensis DSM 2588]
MPSTTNNSHPSRQRYFYAAYWVMVTLIFLYDRTYLIQKAGLPNFFICALVRVSLLIALAWLNIHWLIPRFLLHEKYAAYFTLVLLLLLGYLVVQSGYDFYLFGYVLGPGRNARLSASLIYNFTHTSLYLLLTIALKFSMDWYEQKKIVQEIRLEKLQAEVNYLHSQINPHFLFNALNNLYALTLKKSDEAPAVVLKLAELMEYMLYESEQTVIPLEKEISYLNNYLELEKIRQDNQADIRLTVTGDVQQYWLPPFLIFPLVENAFKHGISKAVHNAFLFINIDAGPTLDINIANNKGRIPPTMQNGGIGLLNLRKRLELLFPGKHTLEITNHPERFLVHLKIMR